MDGAVRNRSYIFLFPYYLNGCGGEVVKDVCASPFQKIRVLIVVEDHVDFERDFELLVKM